MTPDQEGSSSTPASNKPDPKRPDPSVILTRTNIILFVVVVVLGALILAQMCIVSLLIVSPPLRERIYGPSPTEPAPIPQEIDPEARLFIDVAVDTEHRDISTSLTPPPNPRPSRDGGRERGQS
jgi:hypothetical protein